MPSPDGQETPEEGQEAPKKKAKKPQSYDTKGCPHFKGPSDVANTGMKAAMLAVGLEPKSTSPYPNLNFEEDDQAEPEGTSEASEAAAIQQARQLAKAIRAAKAKSFQP